MSTRLTISIREEISKAALAHRFADDVKALIDAKAEFAAAVYADLYSKADRPSPRSTSTRFWTFPSRKPPDPSPSSSTPGQGNDTWPASKQAVQLSLQVQPTSIRAGRRRA